MKTVYLSYYKNFKCIAEKCPDTCCAGWTVNVDDASFEKYSLNESDFGKRLKENIICQNNIKCFKLKGDRCAFLNDKNLCDIYSVLGKEALTEVCSSHPRFTENYGLTTELTLSLSCPEAARLLIESTEGLTFMCEENDKLPEPNEIDPELFIFLKNARQVVFDIINNKKLDFLSRLATIYNFCVKIQALIKEKNYCLPAILTVKATLNKKKIHNILNAFKKLEYSRKFIPDIISKNDIDDLNAFFDFVENYEDIYLFENLLTVYVYRYFLTATFDKRLIHKVKLVTASILFIMLSIYNLNNNKLITNKTLIKLITNFSRELFHSEENIKKLTFNLKNTKLI